MNNLIRKNYFDTDRRQRLRNKATLLEKLKEAQRFASLIGLQISQVTLDKKTSRITSEQQIDIIIKNETPKDHETDKEQKLLKSLAFKDKAMISNIKYKMSRSVLDFAEIPGLNKVIKFKEKFDSLIELRPTNSYGVYVNVRQKITTACGFFLKRVRKIEPNYNPEKFTIKVSCDGTIITRAKVNILNLSFTIINDRKKCKTAFGNFILGVFQYYKEDYETLSEALPEVATELNQINNIVIDNTTYQIEKKLGGDMKNLAILLGIVPAKGHYACLWCHCNLFDDMPSINEYKIERTHKEGLKYLPNRSFGYINKPIFNFIEFKDVTIDMLHLHLRITDKLFCCLINKLTVSDEYDGIELDQRPALRKFESFLISCNITNPFIYNQEGDMKINLRTLDAKERVIIFEKLFENGKKGFLEIFANYDILEEHNFMHENFVWNEFRKIYNQIKALDEGELIIGENFDLDGFRSKLKQWFHFYKKIDTMENTSPYVHAFVFHMPEFLEKHGNINLYNCQGLEKLNDFSTKFFHNSTNKNKKNQSFLIQLIKKMNRMEFFNSGQNLDDLFYLIN